MPRRYLWGSSICARLTHIQFGVLTRAPWYPQNLPKPLPAGAAQQQQQQRLMPAASKVRKASGGSKKKRSKRSSAGFEMTMGQPQVMAAT